ncbi:HAD superfamily, subfamily IIIB acid phosphatase [Artemisia annua]|uniref:HAD superfamily, subfamily IIIB acid phosphatase n=1 Tax=Artemisia annua TaxID=35608 RepID=A0A2U1N5R1_ARTAN|nr:HAD superfamily, subfamily IIIB acid phosphatase [Artemisia annua]
MTSDGGTNRGGSICPQGAVSSLITEGRMNEAYKGQSGIIYKSEMRRKLMEEGYRIWGNVGDQWSDLHGQFVGNTTFKLPNPMYFVP